MWPPPPNPPPWPPPPPPPRASAATVSMLEARRAVARIIITRFIMLLLSKSRKTGRALQKLKGESGREDDVFGPTSSSPLRRRSRGLRIKKPELGPEGAPLPGLTP